MLKLTRCVCPHRHVKALVGVIDFSFHVKDRESSDDSSIDTIDEKKKD